MKTSGASVELPNANSPEPLITKPNVAAVEYCTRNAGSVANTVVISTGGDTDIVPDTATLISVLPEQSMFGDAEFNIKSPVMLPISRAKILLICL
ncbi:hypothetical protein E24_00050 [Faustovirus]|nr:hypothetical protein E24_00050 [Faustovirus]AMN83971.1 hypothetical protein D5a_00050 [Faustovirus]AMN84954.1 hypothetical protein E23_00050 [Faustovirus]